MLHPNMVLCCALQCPPWSPSYLHPEVQISTEGSVKPFFPSFTNTGFSVRVCQTRICVSRDTKQSRAGPQLHPATSLFPPTSCKYSSLAAFVPSRLSQLFFISAYPLILAVCTCDAFKVSVGNEMSRTTENRQVPRLGGKRLL